MIGSSFRRLLAVGALAGLATAALRLLRGHPSEVFRAPALPAAPRGAGILAPERSRPAPGGAVEPSSTAAPPRPSPAPAGRGWVEPVEGICPTGYPLKAKLTSGIYHRPGMVAYDRTHPDRCYATDEAAQADGLRPAKR